MRARAWALGILSSTAVLVLGWQAGTHTATAVSATTTTSTATSTAAPPTTDAPSRTPAASGAATASPRSASGTFTGDAVSTAYGPVQVKVTVQNGAITDVTPLSLTNRDSHSVAISNRAAPMLRDEVLQAQSAHVDGVSGATYTTEGYLTSLQSALDEAGR